jgi:hypothetical protein
MNESTIQLWFILGFFFFIGNFIMFAIIKGHLDGEKTRRFLSNIRAMDHALRTGNLKPISKGDIVVFPTWIEQHHGLVIDKMPWFNTVSKTIENGYLVLVNNQIYCVPEHALLKVKPDHATDSN